MSLLDGLKGSAGKRALRKELKSGQRKVVATSYAASSRVGVLYQADDPADHERVKKYVRHLKEEEGIRKIMALGYFSGKVVPEYLQAKLSFDFFTKKELNWQQRPSGTVVQNFIDESYDILIDLSPANCVPLRFILVQSKANFKVGMMSEANQPFYDFFIDTGDTLNQDTFIEQANHYLKIINNGNGN